MLNSPVAHKRRLSGPARVKLVRSRKACFSGVSTKKTGLSPLDTRDLPAGRDPQTASAEFACVVALASGGWRLTKLLKRALEKMELDDAARLSNQVLFLEQANNLELKKVGLKIVDLEGQPYDTGMAATALNVADFAQTEDLTVDRMIEPIILGPSGLLQYGVVTLRSRL